MGEPSSGAEPTLGEVIRRLVGIENKMERAFVQAEVYQAEKSAAIEARQSLELRLRETFNAKGEERDRRITSLEGTITWLLRLLIAQFLTGAGALAFYLLN